jgi:hypothetical protein
METVDVNAVVRKVKWTRWPSVALIILAIATPTCGMFGLFMPDTETIPIWFQRSGAVMTIFALLCTTGMASALKYLSPAGTTDLDLIEAEKKYRREYAFMDRTALWLTIVGTFVWGYGDVLHNAVVRFFVG